MADRRFGQSHGVGEVAAVYFAGRSIVTHVRTPKDQRSPLFSNANCLPFLILAIWGIFLCVFRGQDFADALFQARSLPLYGLVGLAATNFIKTEDDLWNFFRAMAACSIIKSLQGLMIWYDDFGAGAIKTRYLIDHYYSDAFVHTILFLTGSIFLPSSRPIVIRAIWRILCVVPVCLAMYLNNRRTAYIGGAFSMAFLPFFVAPVFMRRHARKILKVGALGLGCFALILLRKFNGNTGHSYIIDNSALYRVHENLNLLELVRYFPFTGAGLGVSMPLTHSLASLGTVYREFKLIPHNSLLYIWAFLGPIALALFACYCAEGIASGLKLSETYPRQSSHDQIRSRIMGFLVLSQVIRWLVYVFSDMGLVEARFGLVIPLVVAGATIIVRRNDKSRLADKAIETDKCPERN